MSKKFEAPIIEEVSAPQTTKQNTSTELKDSAVTSMGRQTTKTSVTLADIYIRQINEFDDWVLGKHTASGPDERKKAMVGFMRLFTNILKADQSVANSALRQFMINVNTNLKQYNSGELFGPIFMMKKKEIPYDTSPERFMDLVLFLIGLAENIQNVSRYIGGRDLAYFFRDWSKAQRDTLINFINNTGN